jgi:hypothetical protein
VNHAGLEMLDGGADEIFRIEKILEDSPDVLLLTSCGNLDSDISNIRKVRIAAPGVRIVMFGGTGAEREFLQYVRAGIRGYLLMGASVKDVWETLEAVSELALRPVVQLFRVRGNEFAFGSGAATAGFDAPRAATDSADCGGAHEQGNCESFLLVGANGEESFIPNEA